MFADMMDIRSLLRWRSTCSVNYIHGTASLRRTLMTRLQPFIPSPLHFVDIVTQHGAVIGGELALSFFLRHEDYRPSCLEIYASNFQYNDLCTAILDEPDIKQCVEKHVFLTSSVYHAMTRLVAETLIIHMKNGRTLYVYQSYTCSSSAPVTRSTCTALSNFVTGHSFGCSHPVLTLAGRGLLADRELMFLSARDNLSIDNLLAHGFSLAVSPTAWPEYRRDIDDDTLRSAEECWREKFVCPSQGRFFGDKGSLVGFFDPLSADEDKCVANNLAPFGPMVIWRSMSTFDCDDGCDFLDDVLEQGVTSIPVLFRKDPFGELRDDIADRRMYNRAVTVQRRFTRARTWSF